MASGTTPISVEAVSKWYGPVIGVNEVTCEIFPGITGLLGPNGSGKSTLMKLITGQIAPSLGQIRVFGQPVTTQARARSRLGFVPEIDRFYEEMRGTDFVYHMAKLSGLSGGQARRRTEEIIDFVGMNEHGLKKLHKCSKGMRQRIKIAQGLVHNPEILILDEPLTGVDPEGRMELIDLFKALRDQGKTLLISSHILEEIEAVTDRILLIAWGRLLASGTLPEVRELLTDHPLTLRIVGEPLRALGAIFIEQESVAEVTIRESLESGSSEELVVRVKHPNEFFENLPQLLESVGGQVKELEPLDASMGAVFEYLLRGHSPVGGRRG